MAEKNAPTFPDDATDDERIAWVNAIANMRVLAQASGETVEALLGQITFRRHEPKALIVDATAAADRVYFLVAGVVRVFQAQDKVQYTAKLLTPPVHFGELAPLAGLETNQSNIEAVTPCAAGELALSSLETLLAEDAALCRAWLYSVARQFSVTIDFLKQNVFGGVAARLANVLLSYAQALGKESADGWTDIGVELSYAQLARQAACTRRSAIDVMKAMANEGAVLHVGESGWKIKPQPLHDLLLPGRLSLAYAQTDTRDLEDEDG